MAGARIKEPEAAKVGAADASIFGIPLMKGIFLIVFYRDDVMMIRCCVQRMTSRRFNKIYKGKTSWRFMRNEGRCSQDFSKC